MVIASYAGTSAPGGAGNLARAGEIFQLLRDGQARTRSELAASTGLARSTVAARIDALLESGMVGPAGEAASSGGRPPSRFVFNPSARTVLGVDVGATHVLVAASDLTGRILAKERHDIDIADGPTGVLSWIVTHGQNLLEKIGCDASALAGVGIGLPGPVEHSTGKPTNPPIMPGWDGFDVPGFIQGFWDTQVLVDNDVNIMALGEQANYWPDEQNLIFVKVATGIGAGIISSGALQRGAVGTAGDLGHVRVPRGDAVRCRCGNYGCLEALASGPAVAAALSRTGVDVQTGSEVLQLARNGNEAARDALRQAGRDIGDVLTTCVSLLNPSMIVIGGSVAYDGESVMAGIREVVYRRSMPLATAQLNVVLSKAGNRAGVLGASRMVIEHVLSPASIESIVAGASG
jgi:predicted NBD/HSP70 family sugar kinase